MPETDLALLNRAAVAAGKIALDHFGQSPDRWDKPDGAGPVTAADLAVNSYLVDVLQQARPDYGWLSEETPDNPDRLTRKRTFIIDPIDGTRAFIENARDWAISLAVVTDGVPTAAVVHMPARDLTFDAETGRGATRNGAPIRATDTTDPAQATVLTAKSNLGAQYWQTVPPVKRTFRSSLAYRMALVAQGRFDAMLTFRPTWEWDIAAGTLLVTEAGGTVTTQDGQPVVMNGPTAQVDGIIAAGAVHPALLAARAL